VSLLVSLLEKYSEERASMMTFIVCNFLTKSNGEIIYEKGEVTQLIECHFG